MDDMKLFVLKYRGSPNLDDVIHLERMVDSGTGKARNDMLCRTGQWNTWYVHDYPRFYNLVTCPACRVRLDVKNPEVVDELITALKEGQINEEGNQ
tara:strand:+ start:2974 stop:3261 length:288 start_codon:yes stop_codon:yes gene_type:complete